MQAPRAVQPRTPQRARCSCASPLQRQPSDSDYWRVCGEGGAHRSSLAQDVSPTRRPPDLKNLRVRASALTENYTSPATRLSAVSAMPIGRAWTSSMAHAIARLASDPGPGAAAAAGTPFLTIRIAHAPLRARYQRLPGLPRTPCNSRARVAACPGRAATVSPSRIASAPSVLLAWPSLPQHIRKGACYAQWPRTPQLADLPQSQYTGHTLASPSERDATCP